MKWSEVIAEPTLRDLPFKIELNEHGSIVMTPASNRHGLLQVRLANRLSQMIPDGEAMVECSIDTPKGVKVADVAWLSAAFLAAHGDETPYTAAPELCIEVGSKKGDAALFRGSRQGSVLPKPPKKSCVPFLLTPRPRPPAAGFRRGIAR